MGRSCSHSGLRCAAARAGRQRRRWWGCGGRARGGCQRGRARRARARQSWWRSSCSSCWRLYHAGQDAAPRVAEPGSRGADRPARRGPARAAWTGPRGVDFSPRRASFILRSRHATTRNEKNRRERIRPPRPARSRRGSAGVATCPRRRAAAAGPEAEGGCTREGRLRTAELARRQGANVAAAAELVRRAAAGGARLIVLPETWTFKGGHAELPRMAEAIDGPSNTMLAGLAAELDVYVLAGSIYEMDRAPRPLRQRERAVRPEPARRSPSIARSTCSTRSPAPGHTANPTTSRPAPGARHRPGRRG